MKKIISIIICVALLCPALLTSCGRDEEEVSVLYFTFSDAYISSVRSAMEASLKEKNIGYHSYDGATNQTTQTEQVDTAITKGTRLLAVNIIDTGSEDAAKAIISKARAADIPLIFFNRSVDDAVVASYDKCVFIGTDYEQAGHIQGEMIGNYLVENYQKLDINGDGRISYVLFKGQQGNSEAEARTKYSVLDANRILAENGKPSLVFYDKNNPSGFLLDQNGSWSNAAANNHMKTVLSGYSEAGGNMVELVIANNDEMALGALAALEEAGYNKEGGRYIPVFGVDAIEGARSKIREGKMTGTVVQDGKAMAASMAQVAENMLLGREPFFEMDSEGIVSEHRLNIPYSVYTGEEKTE
ncbi:MAG: galactose ABC transporter substrate-binding protein [Clostridia bacterium]|nr:galactose ABC transporter substrate-binding protein [Clostridia bacterium]MBQ8583723.1 galactose ABC transporter substrate-binding protein [Clostridia bacterium]